MLRLCHRRSRPVHIFSDRDQSIRRPGKPTPSLSAESPNPSLVWVPHVSLETWDLPPPAFPCSHSVGPQIRAPFIARSLRDEWDRATTLQHVLSQYLSDIELTYFPELPNPPSPRAASPNSATSSNAASIRSTIRSCAIRSPALISTGCGARFVITTFNSP